MVEYEADGMFVEKALTPNSDIVKYLVNLDERGRIMVDGVNRTNVPGVFAAGDVTTDFAEQVSDRGRRGSKVCAERIRVLAAFTLDSGRGSDRLRSSTSFKMA